MSSAWKREQELLYFSLAFLRVSGRTDLKVSNMTEARQVIRMANYLRQRGSAKRTDDHGRRRGRNTFTKTTTTMRYHNIRVS